MDVVNIWYDRTIGGRRSLYENNTRACKFYFQLDSRLRKYETRAETNTYILINT